MTPQAAAVSPGRPDSSQSCRPIARTPDRNATFDCVARAGCRTYSVKRINVGGPVVLPTGFQHVWARVPVLSQRSAPAHTGTGVRIDATMPTQTTRSSSTCPSPTSVRVGPCWKQPRIEACRTWLILFLRRRNVHAPDPAGVATWSPWWRRLLPGVLQSNSFAPSWIQRVALVVAGLCGESDVLHGVTFAVEL